MSMIELCENRGWTVRKHVKDVFGWTKRRPTVVDLSKAERKILERKGEEALNDHLFAKNCFPFPALDITTSTPRMENSILLGNGVAKARIVHPQDIELKKVARQLQSTIRRRSGGEVPLCVDHPEQLDASDNLIVLGGSHRNRIARELAFKNQCFADMRIPGPDGISIHTLHNPDNSRRNIMIIACDSVRHDEALDQVQRHLQPTGNGWGLSDIHVVRPGADLAKALDVEPCLKSIAKFVPGDAPLDPLDFETLRRRMKSGFSLMHRKGISNNPLMDAVVKVFYCHQVTADIRFLSLFKHNLLDLCDYCLATQGGASYISDYDFFLGFVIHAWSQIEWHPVFSDGDRLLISNLLLASVRQIHRYKLRRWPSEPGAFRFNHETFPALSLFLAYRYFYLHHKISDALEWKNEAEKVFTGTPGKYFKHLENANGYQWFVPLHKYMYDVMSGGNEIVRNGILPKLANSISSVVDNFGFGVDFGDSAPSGGALVKERGG